MPLLGSHSCANVFGALCILFILERQCRLFPEPDACSVWIFSSSIALLVGKLVGLFLLEHKVNGGDSKPHFQLCGLTVPCTTQDKSRHYFLGKEIYVVNVTAHKSATDIILSTIMVVLPRIIHSSLLISRSITSVSRHFNLFPSASA